jgi:hypothetical protein
MVDTPLKPVRLTSHARLQCVERGASEDEVLQAVREGDREPAKRGRTICRLNVEFGNTWQGSQYAVKQVVPVIVEEEREIVVVTVYTFHF